MGVRSGKVEWESDQPSGDVTEADRELGRVIKRAMRGDNGALYSLCEMIANRVLFLATHIMRDPVDAEDVSQEALIRVCKEIGRLRSPDAFWAWVSKIVTNEARMHFRKNARHGAVVNMDDYVEKLTDQDEAILPQEYAENKEVRKLVLELIDTLPPRQREAVLLHYYGGLSVNEIAAEMGIDHANVSRYLALAHEKLRRALEKSASVAVGAYSPELPLSGLVADILGREALSFRPSGPAVMEWQRQALAKCGEVIRLRPGIPVGPLVSKALFWPVTGLISAAVVTAGAYMGVRHYGVPPRTQPSATAPYTVGGIDFSGGERLGEDLIALNPTGAAPQVDNDMGALTAVQWYITPAGGTEKIDGGEGGDIGDALVRLRESGDDGKYTLHVLFRGESGGIYRVYESFLIQQVK